MSSLFLKKAVKYYAASALSIGLFMTSKIVILLALAAYIIYGMLKT